MSISCVHYIYVLYAAASGSVVGVKMRKFVAAYASCRTALAARIIFAESSMLEIMDYILDDIVPACTIFRWKNSLK